MSFPTDSEISAALQTNFEQDLHNAQARSLVRTLGGDKGELQYVVHQVILRQQAFEVRYDVALRMGQPGADSLRQLYATMIAKEARDKLPEQTLKAYEQWLQASAQALDKSDPQQAGTLRRTLDNLGQCYVNAKTGDKIVLMEGLRALLSATRDGWYAEKLPGAQVQVRCLPL